MISRTPSGRSLIGVLSLNLYFFASASKYIFAILSLLMLPHPEAEMAPSRMDRLLFGMMMSGSTRSWMPRPVQVGHAP